MQFPLRNKRALVTGGGTGIGAACAAALLQAGASVTIVGRRAELLARTAKRLEGLAPPGAEIRHATCDVTCEEDVAKAVALASDDGRQLDIAIANAGTAFGSYLLLTDAATFRQALDLNVVGTFNTIRSAATVMKASGGGSIVAISSISAAITIRSMPAYCASKAGMEMLVRCAADELGAFDIRVNAIRPGIVKTEIMEQFLLRVEPVVDEYLENMPIRRIGCVEDVAATARFLVGPEATWITGQILGVDGGHALRRGPNHEALVRPAIGEEAWSSVNVPVEEGG